MHGTHVNWLRVQDVVQDFLGGQLLVLVVQVMISHVHLAVTDRVVELHVVEHVQVDALLLAAAAIPCSFACVQQQSF